MKIRFIKTSKQILLLVEYFQMKLKSLITRYLRVVVKGYFALKGKQEK
jgi:hypothetical protein